MGFVSLSHPHHVLDSKEWRRMTKSITSFTSHLNHSSFVVNGIDIKEVTMEDLTPSPPLT